MKIVERQRAIELRKTGLTYTEIRNRLKVSRASLSYWLRDIPYIPTEETYEKRRLANIKTGRLLHERKLQRTNQIKKITEQEIRNTKFNDLKLLGVMAYWTEGSKTKDHLVQLTNSDPIFIKFILKWLRKVCGVQSEKLKVHLRVHPDVNIKEAEQYWSRITGIPDTQFHKTTAKVSGSGGRRYTKLGYGIATITVCSTDLYYKVMGWIEGLKEELDRDASLA